MNLTITPDRHTTSAARSEMRGLLNGWKAGIRPASILARRAPNPRRPGQMPLHLHCWARRRTAKRALAGFEVQ